MELVDSLGELVSKAGDRKVRWWLGACPRCGGAVYLDTWEGIRGEVWGAGAHANHDGTCLQCGNIVYERDIRRRTMPAGGLR